MRIYRWWIASAVLLASLTATRPTAAAFGLFVAETGGGLINRLDAMGNRDIFASTGLNDPQGLAFDAAGNLYVANLLSDTIRRFSPTGVDLGNFATTGLAAPAGLVFDAAGNLLVANGNNTVRRFSPTGQDLGNFISSGLSDPEGLAFDAAGNLYVVNSGANAVRRFSPTGQDLGNFATTGLEGPFGIAFDAAGNLYVATLTDRPLIGAVRRFSPTGEDLGNFVSGGLKIPQGLTFDAAGNLYVSDALDNAVLKFSPGGALLGQFGPGFANPTFLAFAPLRAGEPQIVPEPSSLVSITLGSLGLLGYAWRLRKAATTQGKRT